MSSAVRPLAAAAEGPPKVSPPQRYVALDAMRGFVMVVLCTEGLGLAFYNQESVARLFHHLKWDGLIPWELIMPAFMFMVGASLPFALARRRAEGKTFRENLSRVVPRTLRMILLGAILYSLHAGHYHADPIETLTQLALSYFCVFLILQLKFRGQAIAAAGLMALNWGLYGLFPGPDGPFSPTANIGIKIDQAVFGIDHTYNWATINFIGSAVTVLFGAWTAMLLASDNPPAKKLKILAGAVVACFAAAAPLTLSHVNPVIHKCWTASFTFFHTGIVLLTIMVFVWLFDVRGQQKLAFPLVVVGMNSIFIYLVNESLKKTWLDRSVGTFTGHFRVLGTLGPVAQAWAVFLVMWYLCHWLYQRKIFFKV